MTSDLMISDQQQGARKWAKAHGWRVNNRDLGGATITFLTIGGWKPCLLVHGVMIVDWDGIWIKPRRAEDWKMVTEC